jgi:isopentenyl-diphosphate Delta-isomerase
MSETLIPAIAPDGSLFPIEKLLAHQSATLHQAISVFVFCGENLLIQRRALSKYHCGGAWANTCCTHPNWGESLADSAHRRLQQELGVEIELHPANVITYKAEVTNGLWEHEQVQTYQAHVDRNDLVFSLNTDEVSEVDWVPLATLRTDATANPHKYAPWFVIYLQRWDELGVGPIV